MNKSLVIGCFAVIGMGFMSCSKDLYDSNAVNEKQNEKQKNDYATNFVKRYGEIDPNQTWDFATMAPVYSLPSATTATRSGESSATVELKSTDSIIIEGGEGSVFDWLRTNMPAGQNHSKVGSPFKAVMSRNTFIVAPFYQGLASYFWELWVNIDGNPYKIWEKYKDLKYQLEGDAEDEWHTLDKNGLPAGAVRVQAPTYTFEATEGSQLYFFMKVWTGGDNAHAKDPEGKGNNVKILTSLENGNMRALQNEQGLPKPAGVPGNYFSYLIGCEDGAPDGDFEDFGFLFFGPPIIEVEEVEVRETKRYMIEDLGATDDFDFNDVVVDVSNVWTKKITRQENASTGEVAYHEEVIENSKRQEAIVRSAGGTLDFTINIGSSSWTKSENLTPFEQMMNTGWNGSAIDYNAKLGTFNIENKDWDPQNNNITVSVVGRGTDTGVQVIKFPKKGTVPMIIAVDQKEKWMSERQGVPADWFTTE